MALPSPPSSIPPLRAEILSNSSGVLINGGNFQSIAQTNQFNANSRIGKGALLFASIVLTWGLGLRELYRTSIPEAAHDSSTRKHVPKCYPGTREQHIQDFTLWASNTLGQQRHRFRMSWMEGPFGVGKTTIAQTCAGKIGEALLGATFFFSRPNQIDDPDRFFPSIAYQIATKVKPFADILDERICNDLSMLTKTMEVQFRELIVLPFLELKERGVLVQERVVIIDGLDECKEEPAQCVIVELIATAVRDHGGDLPLVWSFFSRPEPHIVQTFSAEAIFPFVWTMSLPVSREVDKEIELYIRGQFKNISKRIYHLPPYTDDTWPSEPQISALLHKSAGLFVHASTAMKYVDDPEASDPKGRLDEVVSSSLCLPKPFAVAGSSPTAEIDSLYTLIMRRIPPHVLPTTQQILLLTHYQQPHSSGAFDLTWEVVVLGLSAPSVMIALSKLRSVLAVDETSFSMTFHHASFIEYLRDVNRSGPEFCITQPQQYGTLLKRILSSLGLQAGTSVAGELQYLHGFTADILISPLLRSPVVPFLHEQLDSVCKY